MKQLTIDELMDLQVTSVSRVPEKVSEVASAVQVVTGDEIRRSGASSLPEALRLADNLDVAQKNSHDWGISARGFNTELSNKLLVMIDGRTVYTPLFSGVIWAAQDYLLEDIDRIEVISGPGGALWGANAVNGVINVMTRSAKDSQGLFLEGGGGSVLSGLAGARYGGTLRPGVYFRVYGKYADRDEGVLASGTSAEDSSRFAQAGFRLDSEASPQNTVTVAGDYYDGDQSMTTGETDTSGGNLRARWTHFVSEESEFSLQLYYDRTHLRQPAPALMAGAVTLAPGGVFQDDLDTYDLDFQHRFGAGMHHRIVWGLSYRFTHDVVSNAPALAFFPARLDQNLFGGFVQDTIALGQTASLSVGTKFERHNYTGVEFEPSARVQWSASLTQSFWGAVSRAVRRPSRIDHDLSLGAPPYFTLLKGNPDFSSETVTAYELGYRARFGQTFATSLSLFYNDYDDIRSTAFSPVTVFPLIFQNNLEGHTEGFELTADFQPVPRWRLHAGYTLLQEHLRIKPGQADINKALNETSDPGHQFFLRSSVDLPYAVEFDTAVRWVDSRPGHRGSTPGTLPGYAELDLRIGWHLLRNLELSLVGRNLLHDHHREYGFPSDANVEIGRSVWGKAAWRF